MIELSINTYFMYHNLLFVFFQNLVVKMATTFMDKDMDAELDGIEDSDDEQDEARTVGFVGCIFISNAISVIF